MSNKLLIGRSNEYLGRMYERARLQALAEQIEQLRDAGAFTPEQHEPTHKETAE